jgi:hypothetical protein
MIKSAIHSLHGFLLGPYNCPDFQIEEDFLVFLKRLEWDTLYKCWSVHQLGIDFGLPLTDKCHKMIIEFSSLQCEVNAVNVIRHVAPLIGAIIQNHGSWDDSRDYELEFTDSYTDGN